jgi:predicted phage-related endonuclease
VIFWLERTILSSILYSTHTQEWIGEDVRTSYLLQMSHQMIEVILSLCFDKSSCIFFVLFNAHVIYCNILFQLSDYYCLLFCRY